MAKETYQARVLTNRLSTPKVFSTELELIEPAEFHFKAGQFITVPVGEKLLRSYSIASTPRDASHLLLIVDVAPGGPGSQFFHHLREGDAVSFQGPYGAFCLRDDSDPGLLFVATGTGIAPIRGILHDLYERSDPRPITLFYGCRYHSDLIFHDEFLELAARHPTFTYYPTLTQPENGQWDGSVGRVTAHLPHFVHRVGGKTAFLCGSRQMLKDVTEILTGLGMDRKKIKKEQFY